MKDMIGEAKKSLSNEVCEDITVHMIVRDEEMFVEKAIRSVSPYVARMIVYLDSRSKDSTWDILWRLRYEEELSRVHLYEMVLGDKYFGKWRDILIQATDTPFFLTVDGDEVYTKAGIEKLIWWTKNFPKDKNTLRVQVRWFIKDRFTICDTSPSTAIRLYRTEWNGRRCRCSGGHPGEMHHYDGQRPEDMLDFHDPEIKMYHYSWIQKPNPGKGRKATNIRPFTGEQPEVFGNA